jgi:hypothetical protein
MMMTTLSLGLATNQYMLNDTLNSSLGGDGINTPNLIQQYYTKMPVGGFDSPSKNHQRNFGKGLTS